MRQRRRRLGWAFVETGLQRELKMIDPNVRGAVQLTKLVLKDMVARDSGKILFTSPVAATMPDPFGAVYGTTKIFLRWFGEALRNELKDTGMAVTVLMPSVTEINFFSRAEMTDARAGQMENKDDPAVVAKARSDALMADKHKIVPLLKNKVMAGVADVSPLWQPPESTARSPSPARASRIKALDNAVPRPWPGTTYCGRAAVRTASQ
ncbi:short-subunit dehydrogenase [Sphingomonas xinjiangensis]|uniref:Short-subunit dehydrogenase n=1 Tax=Sphingomonas xinjiangensis TaxID=643568 RepID=A0A840YNQ8_9SPHN|nr:short-subunit dehydrogenase [Sphingomonas xinjiangensis]